MILTFFNLFLILYVYLFLFHLVDSFELIEHPIEKRIAYIRGFKDLNTISTETTRDLYHIFQKHPFLIFKEINNVSPSQFLDFVKKFDIDHDNEALTNPEKYPHQMLQPFDQFPDCNHVAPRGNIELLNYHQIKNVKVEPYDSFINNYVWHVDMLGHDYKLPNMVTGFYIVEQPVIGGDTDFISGETIYENLNIQEKLASHNILLEINRRKFVTNQLRIDYAGVNRLEPFEPKEEGNMQIPIVFLSNPENEFEKPSILLMPTFFERVVGWTIEESRDWISNFMLKNVLPHRVSIQWKKGDLAIFNNRRFIHSSSPARNYLDYPDSNKRLLLQTFIPTTKPLFGLKPFKEDVYSCYNCKWIKDQEKAIISAHHCIKFMVKNAIKNGDTLVTNKKYYIISKKVDRAP